MSTVENLSVLCHTLKKEDPTVCANYRGITLLAIAFKVLTRVMCMRLIPIVKALIESY